MRTIAVCEKNKGMLETNFAHFTILTLRKPNQETYVDKTRGSFIG